MDSPEGVLPSFQALRSWIDAPKQGVRSSGRARDRRFSVDVRLSVVGVIFAKSISKSPPCDFLEQRFSSEKHETLSGEQIRGERVREDVAAKSSKDNILSGAD